MTSTDDKIPILNVIEDVPILTEEENDESVVVSVTENISRVRLTLEEIIANDNDTSRQHYIPTNSPKLSIKSCLSDDQSSVSSGLASDTGSIMSSSSSGVKSFDNSSIVSSKSFNDPFRGVDDDEFGNLDRYGFLKSSKTLSFTHLSENEFMEKERLKLEREKEKEASRALKWISMLKNCENESNINLWPQIQKKLASRLVKGVPDCLRTRVWANFLNIKGLYPVDQEISVKDIEFAPLYLKVSGFERQIDLDIERTLRDHILFKIRYSQAQISLFKILVAYSNLDPEVGYCQGMSTIAAFLLLYFDEAGAFESFVKLMSRDNLRLMYRNGFPLLFEYFWIQERLMKKFLPNLWTHLSKHCITTSIYATKWYLTLFLSFPTRLAARIWDMFLFYGLDVLPLTAVALLKMHEKRICSMGFEETMQFLGRIADAPSCSCPDELLRMIGQLVDKYFGTTSPLDNDHCRGFKKYRKEYLDQQTRT